MEGDESEDMEDIMKRILAGGIEAVSTDIGSAELALGSNNIEQEVRTEMNRGVSAVASGTNSFTFFANQDENSESSDYDEEVDDGHKSRESPEPAGEKDLTEKYLAGEVTFKDFMKQMKIGEGGNNDSSDQEFSDEDDSDKDEDWRPRSRQTRTKKKVAITAPPDNEGEGDDGEGESADEEYLLKPGKKKRGRGQGGGVRRKKLDPALQGLMGEAHLRFARGDTENGKKMCLEIIRQDPTQPEPFQALANLYEEGEDLEKGLQFALIAAQLATPDPDEWSRLADMSLEQSDVKLACFCYKKASESDPSNVRYYVTRSGLLEQLGDKSAALRCYRKMLANLKPDQGPDFLFATREAARLLHEKDQLAQAQSLFDDAFDKFPDLITADEINLFLEMLIIVGNYEHALVICCKHANISFDYKSGSEEDANIGNLEPKRQLEAFSGLVIPDDLLAEIRSKLAVILINLNAIHLCQGLFTLFLEADPEDFGDLILEIAEALMKNRQFEEAAPFFQNLVNSEKYSEAVVWLQFAECLFGLGRLEDSEQAYTKVVELAPHHYSARLQLSKIMRSLGRPEDALLALAQDESEEMLNPHLLFNRCKLLLEEGRQQDFLDKAKLLFSRHFVTIRNKEELDAISSAKRLSCKNKALTEIRNFRREPLTETEAAEFEQSSDDVSVTEEFHLFCGACDMLFEREEYEELQRLAYSALGSPVFARDQKIFKECEFLCLLASFFNGDSFHAYNWARELVVKDIKNPAIWNMLNVVIMRADDVRHNRFLMRLMSRNPDNLALGILNGHNCLVAGTYKYSLGEYMSAFKQDSSNPLIALMLGLTFCHMACQKFSAKKHSLVVQACAFLNTYKELRGECQEVYYNLGRTMHQLNLLPAALFYYKKALQMGPSVPGGGQEAAGDENSSDMMDLKAEIAYNVSLIYISSGNPELARFYTEKYIVI